MRWYTCLQGVDFSHEAEDELESAVQSEQGAGARRDPPLQHLAPRQVVGHFVVDHRLNRNKVRT